MQNKWICKQCNKPKLPNQNDFKIGDEVRFTASSGSKNSIRMTSKTGVIQTIQGDDVVINSRNKLFTRDIGSITPEDAPSPLTYFFGACKCENEVDSNAE